MIFEDVTLELRSPTFAIAPVDRRRITIVEVPSGGVAIFDYDGDGRPDIYILNGSTFDAMSARRSRRALRFITTSATGGLKT